MSLVLVFAAALVGSLAGFPLVRRLGPACRRRPVTIATLVVVAILATAGSNAAQPLLDLGLPFTAVDAIEAASYFSFGFSVTAAWMLLRPLRGRWLLLLLVPVALLEPLRSVFLVTWWWIRRWG